MISWKPVTLHHSIKFIFPLFCWCLPVHGSMFQHPYGIGCETVLYVPVKLCHPCAAVTSVALIIFECVYNELQSFEFFPVVSWFLCGQIQTNGQQQPCIRLWGYLWVISRKPWPSVSSTWSFCHEYGTTYPSTSASTSTCTRPCVRHCSSRLPSSRAFCCHCVWWVHFCDDLPVLFCWLFLTEPWSTCKNCCGSCVCHWVFHVFVLCTH